jgi:hypothetical protein
VFVASSPVAALASSSEASSSPVVRGSPSVITVAAHVAVAVAVAISIGLLQ